MALRNVASIVANTVPEIIRTARIFARARATIQSIPIALRIQTCLIAIIVSNPVVIGNHHARGVARTVVVWEISTSVIVIADTIPVVVRALRNEAFSIAVAVTNPSQITPVGALFEPVVAAAAAAAAGAAWALLPAQPVAARAEALSFILDTAAAVRPIARLALLEHAFSGSGAGAFVGGGAEPRCRRRRRPGRRSSVTVAIAVIAVEVAFRNVTRWVADVVAYP
jgi:hypothetical protein